MYEQEDTNWSFVVGLFFGAVAGAAAASLFTPRSGAQNREVVLDKGLVLKDRVTNTTTSVASTVKETTSSAVASLKETTNNTVTSVRETTNNAIATVKETTNNAVETVKEATNTATAKVSDTVATVKEKANTAVERVSEVASTATEKVQEAASTATEKIQDVTSAAADKARSLTSRTEDAAEQTPAAAPPTLIDVSVSERAGMGADTALDDTAEVNSDALATLASINTFEPTMASEPIADDAQLPTAEVQEVLADLVSDEQFEVAQTNGDTLQERTAGTSLGSTDTADVREASEGADRTG